LQHRGGLAACGAHAQPPATSRKVGLLHFYESTLKDPMAPAWVSALSRNHERLPPEMKEAIEQFRTQLGAAVESVEFVKRALDREMHETDHGLLADGIIE
jgi:hypothetical protein